MSNFGYVSVIREIELGWGDRPDGYIIALTYEECSKFIENSEAFDRVKYPKEFSEAGTLMAIEITEKAVEEIKNSNLNAIWIRPKDFSDYIIKRD